jgi:tetratricopeptide (TPR) repeat protein
MVALLSAFREWRERREILRDVAHESARMAEFDRIGVRDAIAEALAVAEQGDRRTAAMILNKQIERNRIEVIRSARSLHLLIKLGDYDQATALMDEGKRRFPRNSHFTKGLAMIAQARGDNEAAIRYCEALRKRFPGVDYGYIGAVQVLSAVGRDEEADKMALEAMKRFPEEIGGFLEYCRIADRRKDWIESARRWERVRTTFPHRTFGWVGHARANIAQGRYDEADEELTAAAVHFPTDTEIRAESARVAQLLGDIPEAVRRWKVRIQKAPMEFWGYYGAAEACTEMGEYAEAEAMLRAACERFPVDDHPWVLLGKCLADRGNHVAAMDAWTHLLEAFPANQEAYRRGAEALRHLGRTDEADALTRRHQQRLGS